MPTIGYYDDGSTKIAQACNPPCLGCLADADNCTSCIDPTYTLDTSSMKCNLCPPYFYAISNLTNATIC
jgi:hypothetical protein